MRSFVTSAPGKVVLFGEYAVLFGAPALVAAIDRRTTVTLSLAPSGLYEVTAPGLASEPALFDIGADGAPEWHDKVYGRSHFGLVERIIQRLTSTGEIPSGGLPTFAATLDTRAFFETQSGRQAKLGLGSSAALTVALASALEGWAGVDRASAPDLERLQSLVDLHRHVQGGTGSGIDVAASMIGGVLRYRLGDDGAVAVAAPISLPEDLHTVFVWTGRSASTGGFLERLEHGLEARPQDVEPALNELGAVSVAGVAAATAGETAALLDAVDAFWRALDGLGRAITMPILSEEHQVLRGLAVASSVHYKPSGAGGGDLGVGFAIDEIAVSRMAERAVSAGFRVLDLRIDPMGLVRTS
jgi:phosphomevalonate kinase